MSRVSDFGDVYVGSRDRLLLQLYAYCGDAAAADDALNEAFILASHHWHRVASLENVDGWLRQRAVRRLDRRPPGAARPQARRPSPQNARLLATLASLDPTSRRLLIVRRLDNLGLSAAAREVGLSDGAAEQALARATSSLHTKGVDTTPTGLLVGLSRLSEDLAGLDAVPARALLLAGARRRYVAAGFAAVAIVAVAAIAGTVAASRPDADNLGAGQHPTTSPTTTTTTPATTPTVPPARLGTRYLLSAAQVERVDAGSTWSGLPPGPWPPSTSVYGDGACVQAADNPPPDSSWIRDFANGSGRARTGLREVLQLAPSHVEAARAYRQVVAGFGSCEGRQLLAYSRVRVVGERSQLIQLREPTVGGIVTTSIIVSQTGPAVTSVSSRSPAGRPPAIGPAALVKLAGAATDRVCTEVGGQCAVRPFRIVVQAPPTDATAPGFLSAVDLPPVPHVIEPWVGTDPSPVRDNPSATACDRTSFRADGGTQVSARTFVIPQAERVPTLFGLTQTRASFASQQAARAFMVDVSHRVATCHRRQVTLTVTQATSFTSGRSKGWVWQIRQRVSKNKLVIFRVALVRAGSTVSEVTFTPVGAYDVPQATFIALAKRAMVRLDD